MADNNDDAAAVVDGVAESKIEQIQSDNPKERLFSVTFDNFEDLIGAPFESSDFSCFGTQWGVSIYPSYDHSFDEMVGLYLERRSGEGKELAVKYSFTAGLKYGNERISRQGRSIFRVNDDWGWPDFCRRKDVIGSVDKDDKGYLEKGALVVHVGLELDEFIPRNPASSNMLKLFDDDNSADVVFEICEQHKQSESSTSNERKMTNASTAKLYHAHRLILQHYSSELSALCAISDGMTPIIINDIKPEVFRHLIYYVYGGEITDDEFLDNERDLINAADKYGVTNLKLEAEVWYVKNVDITIDNVIDTLLYAHAMNCALIKESVMDFIVENKQEVLQRVSFQDVPGDVCKDLLAAMSRHYDEDSTGDDENETDIEKICSKMRIRDLRRMLDDKGLDIDGSREALIAKLKES